MAQRGRPKKQESAVVACPPIDHAKLLKQFEEEQRIQLEDFYKKLAKIKVHIDSAYRRIDFIGEAETLSEAAFKAGRAYESIDKANDELGDILDEIYDNNDFEYWDDLDN